ncbi:CCDC174 family protein [Aspergillus candidus]|uniref:Uncharacterized protein n=1 Tax=Aspergillus candidus TaxID=41067 RepID=A0A2I2FJD7_ASPCN|nr:hypothetical protein BDW47DRAFT_123286 [Aspergillus candidus]PLB40747.1 hypothetical protein BDW47DRAFT_123286 [Aspergillus candidus]
MPPENLYGLPRPATKDSDKNKNKTNTPSSSTLAFTTKLSSLISSPSQSQSHQHTTGRPRPKTTRGASNNDKDDIFARPNRGTAERAAADENGLNDRGKKRSALEQVHTTDSGPVDEALLERSKRRLREKEGLYDILKEGRHLVYSDDEGDSFGEDDEGGNDGERQRKRELRRLARKEREGLVDFDAKWARSTSPSSSKGSSSSKAEEEDEEEDDDNASIISYEDELGRTRRGTRKAASRAAAAAIASTKSNNPSHPSERWKPAQPANLIHGSTIQTQAFDPDAPTATHMARLAARRDRSATPPEEMHYDASGEVRARGTEFYAFSRDEGVRRGQMEALQRGREETERGREERKLRRERRGLVRVERGRKIEELRGRRRAEAFLEGLS